MYLQREGKSKTHLDLDVNHSKRLRTLAAINDTTMIYIVEKKLKIIVKQDV